MAPYRRFAAILVVAVMALASCGSAAGDPTVAFDPTAPPTDDTTVLPRADAVLVLGDSLTNGARRFGELGRRLRQDGFDDVTVIAEDGRDVSWAIDEITDRDAVAPIVVVELGTNPSAAVAGFADGVVELLAALRSRGAEHIAWLTPAHGRDDRYDEKVAVLSITPGIDLVADWASLVRDDPRRLAADGLHPTEDGYTDLARFLADTASELAD
jgi:lysophospholipase L1-like esterase